MKIAQVFIILLFFFTQKIAFSQNEIIISIGERPAIDYDKVPENAYEKGILIIKFKPEVSEFLDLVSSEINKSETTIFGIRDVDNLNSKYKVKNIVQHFYTPGLENKFKDRHRTWGFHLWYRLEFDDDVNIQQMIREYRSLAEIEVVEPSFLKKQISQVQPETPLFSIPETFGQNAINWTPNDPMYNTQWHYHNTGQQSGTIDADIDLPEAWDIEKGSSNVIVAIIDGGIQINHPDIAANMWSGTGYNFVTGNSNISADNHGTHVAGTVAAVNNNGTGVSGIAGGSGTGDGVRLMSCQVFTNNSSGGFHLAPIYAADNGASISQNSWSYSSVGVYEQNVLDAIDYFNTYGGGAALDGGITIFAAGNDNDSGLWYPGCYSGVFAVAATNNQDIRSYYSNYASWVDISAPGGETYVTERGIRSTISGNNYAYYQGTSMACPHVSGVAALVISLGYGMLSASDVADILKNSTDNHYGVNPGYINQLGTGRLNAYAALLETQNYLSGLQNPASFTAAGVSTTQINLFWTSNTNGDDVMIAWSPVNVFGTPVDGTLYNVGQSIPGGGTILYKGSANSFNHMNLASSTMYYYKAYSYNASNSYSSGKSAQAQTLCDVSQLPFSENFNALPTLPICWEVVDNQGNGQVWQFGAVGLMNGTTGNYAYLNSDAYGSGNSQNSDLVTPTIDMTGYTNVTLNFTHYFRAYTGSSATLSYSINNGSTWNTIQSWNASTSNPINFSLVIPAIANQAQVKFKWNYTGTWGYYWSVDDISITGTPSCTTPGLPTGLTGIASDPFTADISWSEGAPSGSPTVSYTWEVRTTGGSVVSSGSTLSTTATATGLSSNTTYNFRVRATTDCDGTSSSWSLNSGNFTTYPTSPAAVGVNPPQICFGGSTQLFAAGAQGTVYWYTGSCGDVFIGTGNPIQVSPQVTTTYYARNYNGHYSTDCSSGTVTVHPVPSASTGIDGIVCGTGTVDLSVTDVPLDCTIDWYTAPTSGVMLSSGTTTYTTPMISVTTTYYAETRHQITGCLSETRTAVTATVQPLPSTPQVSYNSPVCEGSSLILTGEEIPGSTYQWTGPNGYLSTENIATVSLSSTTQMSGLYELFVTRDGCTSLPGILSVEVHPIYQTITDTLITDQSLPFEWEGDYYYITGTYYHTYQSLYGCDSISQLNLTVQNSGTLRTLALTLYIEGLYKEDTPGLMTEAGNGQSTQYGAGITDKIIVELYSDTSPKQLHYQNQEVYLQTDGTAYLPDIPQNLQGAYYIVIRHRNSIETWSGQSISFAGTNPVIYNFSLSLNQAYGNNMKSMPGGYYAIYTGDVNQDGIVDGTDMQLVDNAGTILQTGYESEDVNGDGIVDGSDMSLIDNNSTNLIQKQSP